MWKRKGHLGLFPSLLNVCLLSFACFLWVPPSEAEAVLPAKAYPKVSHALTVSSNDGLVSVTATEAPLKDVIQRIGQALGIVVEAQIGDDEKVTTEFHDLSLDQALKRLSGNYAYTTDGNNAKLSKLYIYPKGNAAPAGHGVAKTSENDAGRRASSPEPFKFEFDPAEFTQQGQ